MRRYRVLRAASVLRDLDLIEDHLFEAYRSLGDDADSAALRAAARIDEAIGYLRSFERHPHRGTEHPDIRTGIRTVTSNRFLVYFEIDEEQSVVKILAVFFGGMDHRRQIMERLQGAR